MKFAGTVKASPSIAPLSRKDFLKHTLKFLLIQLLVLTLGGLVYGLGYFLSRIDIQILALSGVVLLQAFTVRVWLKPLHLVSRRLIDIYPKFRLPQNSLPWIAACSLCPLAALFLTLFLALKKRGASKNAPPIFFRAPRLTALAVLLVAISPLGAQVLTVPFPNLDLNMGRISYWISNSSTYYLVGLSEEFKKVIGVKNQLQNNPDPPPALPIFEGLAQTRDFSSSGMVLITSVIVMENIKKLHNRSIAGQTKPQLTAKLVEELIHLIEIWDRRKPIVLQFNPIVFFGPVGTLETALIAGTDFLIETKFRQTFIGRLLGMLSRIESSPEVDSTNTPELRAQLEATKSYHIYTSTKASWIGRAF